MIKEKIFQAAIEAFLQNAKLHLNIKQNDPEGKQCNAIFKFEKKLEFVINGKKILLYATIKPVINRADIALFVLKKERIPFQTVFITKYVTPQIAEELKENNIQFIDAAGNAHINTFPFYIYIKGNKVPETFKQKVPNKRIFQPTGLKMLYAVLINNELINMPYREIAKRAGVALGTVGWVMKDLEHLGYLVKMGKRGNRLIQKENLLNRWCTVYAEVLKPKLLIGRFKGFKGWWTTTGLNPLYVKWGGEPAAAKLTKHLKPEIITIYVDEQHLREIVVTHRLARHDQGEIEVYKRFWQADVDETARLTKTTEYDEVVHPILVYADLIATANQRNIEAAKVLYEKYILRYIRQD